MLTGSRLFVGSLIRSSRASSVLSTLKRFLPGSKQEENNEASIEFDITNRENTSVLLERRDFEVKEQPFDPAFGRAVEEVFMNRGALSIARNALGISRRVAEFEDFAGRFLINGQPTEPFKNPQAIEGDVMDFVCAKRSTEDTIYHDRVQLISFSSPNYKGEELMVVRKFKGLTTQRDQFWPGNEPE